ncbi:MAG: 1,4-dihydroxy-2-naphthoate polyprenyltransferase [Acidimicrobiia bacterium]|nr:1,4-dihydroxy-2-naphthoate polyprenyltransferase [Acidimicrobiia bacterium]
MKQQRVGTPSWKSGLPASTSFPGAINAKGPKLTRFQAWKTAARPHTLWASVAPVTVGTGLAVGDGAFRWDALVMTLIVGVAIQVAANFANDASDAARSADTPDRQGPPRMVSEGIISPRRMWTATWAMVAVALAAGLYLILIAGWVLVWVGILSVLAMVTYVGGPWPYGYRGLGELFVFVFFGLVATVGARFVHDATAPVDAWVLAIPMGTLASAILVANNLRDIETDARVGKRTLAVMMGEARSRSFYAALVWVSFVVVGASAAFGLTPVATLATLGLGPFGFRAVRTVSGGARGAALTEVLKSTSRLQMATALALAVTTAAWG